MDMKLTTGFPRGRCRRSESFRSPWAPPFGAVDDLFGQTRLPRRRAGVLVATATRGRCGRPWSVMVVAAEQHVVSPLLPVHLAIAEGVTEGHERLTVRAIAVVPDDSEVGSRDAETFEGFVRAVRPGDPVDERGRSPRRCWRAVPAARPAAALAAAARVRRWEPTDWHSPAVSFPRRADWAPAVILPPDVSSARSIG